MENSVKVKEIHEKNHHQIHNRKHQKITVSEKDAKIVKEGHQNGDVKVLTKKNQEVSVKMECQHSQDEAFAVRYTDSDDDIIEVFRKEVMNNTLTVLEDTLIDFKNVCEKQTC